MLAPPLHELLLWLDHSPNRYWAVVATCGIALLSIALIRLSPVFSRRAVSAWLVGVLLALLLFAGRWPAILDNRQLDNPDESQMLASAIVLKADPVFWKSVDGNTTGPLDQWPLAALGACGLPIDYTTARLFSTILMWVTLFTSWLTLRVLFGDGVAAIGVLPAAILEATTPFWDFLQYSSEHVPMALLSTAGWLLAEEFFTPERSTPRPLRLLCAGLLLACGPFAKLQSAPLGLWLGGFGLVLIFVESKNTLRARTKSAAWLIAGAIAVPAAFAAMLSIYQMWPDFLDAYIRSNSNYSLDFFSDWGSSFRNLLRLIHDATGFSLYFYPAMATLAVLGLFGFLAPRRQTRLFFVMAALLLAWSVFAVALPNRCSTHYVQLMIGPAILATGGAVGALLEVLASRSSWPGLTSRLATIAVVMLFVVVGLSRQIAYCREFVPPNLGQFSLNRGKLAASPESMFLRRNTRPDDAIAMWGWMPRYLVEASRRHATRDAVTDYAIYEGPMREFYRQRYMTDFWKIRPAYFVDTVGPGSFAFEDRRRFGYELFAPLAAEIAANYHLIAEVGNSRFFVRNAQKPSAL